MTKSTDPANDVRATRHRLEEFLNSDAAGNDLAAATTARYHLGRLDVLSDYDSFTEALKSLRVDKAARCALHEPKVVSELATRLPLALERRRRARRGDPFAYDQLFGPHLSRRVPALDVGDVGRPAPARRWRLGKRAAREVAVS